jgi:hypothetical protein
MANGDTAAMSEELADDVMPSVLKALDDKADELGGSSFDYEKEDDEYPEVLYMTLWIYIRPIVFDFLEKEHPNFVNRARYMTSEQKEEESKWRSRT